MPSAIATFTYGDLISQVKQEARLKGAAELDTFIGNILNDLLLDYTQKNRYFELLNIDSEITTTDANGTYLLPDDFCHPSLFRYRFANLNTVTLYKRNVNLSNPLKGSPKYWQITGNTLRIYPLNSIVASETILMDYYAFPAKMVEDTDVFPIPKLINAIKLKAIHRAMRYNNQANAEAFKTDATESEMRIKPSG